MEMSILLLLKAILLLCIPTKSNRSSVRRRIEYRNSKRRRRRREHKICSEFGADSACELHSTLICNCCYGGCSMEYRARGSTGKTWMRMRNNKKSGGGGAIMSVSESCGGNREDEKCRTKNINNNGHKSGGGGERTCCKSRNDCGGGRKLLTKKAMERTRPPISFSSSYYHFLIVVVLLGMCQVSEECPAVCECKWKSGKESVICANAKTKLTEIPSGLDPGTQVLDLSGNSIKALPANVFFTLNLLNLQKIFLSECSLKSLDRLAFAKLKNLVELDLSGNRQEFVPSHAFSQIPELRELKMNSNPISRISNDAFVDLSRLVRLELSGCRIGTIEIAAFRGLPALEWLRLDNNRLFTVQATSFVPLTSLHGLEIHGNPWNCSCALQPFREWMGKNNVPFGVPPVCSQPQRLVGKLWNELALEDFACLPKLLSGTNSGGGGGSSSSSAGGQQSSQQQKSRKIPEGENTTLTCQWEATPDTKIRWWNGNKPVGSNGASGFTSGFLVSESFQWDPDDPQGSNKSTSKTSELSSTKALYSSGKLSKNHTSYDRGVGIKISSLRVIHITPRDAGTYTCRAESRAGSANTNFTLIVVQNKAEHLTGRFLLLGAVLAAFLTLVVSLLLVCVVFGSNSRRHYQSSRISNDDKLELNHVGGETHIVGQNGGGRVPLMGNYHNSHHHRLNNNSSNHHHGGGGSGIAVTTNSILSRRALSNGENHCGSGGGGGAHDKGKAYKAIPTTEPDDSSSELENNGSDLDDCGEVDQGGGGSGGGGGGIGIGSGGGISISTKAIVSSSSSTASTGRAFGETRNRTSNGPHRHHQQQQQQFPLTRMPGVGGETKSGQLVSPETGQQQQRLSSPSHGGFLLTSPQKPVKNNELLGTSGSSSVSTVIGGSGPSDIGGATNSRCNTSELSASGVGGSGGSGIRGVGDGVVGPSGSSTNNPTSQSSSKLFTDKYPDLIDEKMSLESDFASLPRPNKNQQQQYQHHHQMPYKHYIHQKPHHLVDNTVRGYFHRRNNSDSQSPLLSRSYGNSTEKITSSGISILSSSSTESSYVSTYQPSSHQQQQPYTIAQGHHPLQQHHQQQQQQPHPPQYRGSFKGSPVTMNYHQKQHQNPFMPPLSINASYNYPTRQRLSMPTSPVHDHYFADHGAPSVGALRHHSGSHDEGHHGGGLLSPAEQAGGIAYVRTANSGPVGSASNVSYDYHAAQLAAFLEEYRQLQLELMRMSASLQQGGSESGGRSGGGQQAINSPPSDSSSSVGNSNSIMNHRGSHHDMSQTNVNNTSVLFKHPHSTQGTSPREQHQLKSILKNSGNNNNYVA